MAEHHELRVSCDEPGCPVQIGIAGPVRGRLLAQLRGIGWQIDDTDLCPAHRGLAPLPIEDGGPAGG